MWRIDYRTHLVRVAPARRCTASGEQETAQSRRSGARTSGKPGQEACLPRRYRSSRAARSYRPLPTLPLPRWPQPHSGEAELFLTQLITSQHPPGTAPGLLTPREG